MQPEDTKGHAATGNGPAQLSLNLVRCDCAVASRIGSMLMEIIDAIAQL
jgi:hypothetical protein